MQVFGSKCWYHAWKKASGRLGDKRPVAALIRNCSNRKAYKLWDTSKQKVVISRDIEFDRNKSGFAVFRKDSLSKLAPSVTSSCDSQFETEKSPSYRALSRLSERKPPSDSRVERSVGAVKGSVHGNKHNKDPPFTRISPVVHLQ